MAKNSVEAYGASGKTNVLSFETDALTIITDPAHSLYDERIHLPLDEAITLNIMALGVREPILVWKDPETGKVLVVDGRQRVRHAIEANRRLTARGEPGFVLADGTPNPAYATDEARIAAFAELGARVLAGYEQPTL